MQEMQLYRNNITHMKKYTIEELSNEMSRLGHKVFTEGDYNINTVAVRSNENSNGSSVKNIFLDTLYIFYKINNQWIIKDYDVTTIPGRIYFNKPYNPSYGTAILVPGQYRGCYQLGYHYSHPALVQVGMVSCYRDTDKDNVIDMEPASVQSGYYGINIHYSIDNVQTIDNFSAGCTVLKYGPNGTKYKQFLWHYSNSIAKGYKNLFTYTLLNEF
jgi:hypothetical protein